MFLFSFLFSSFLCTGSVSNFNSRSDDPRALSPSTRTAGTVVSFDQCRRDSFVLLKWFDQFRRQTKATATPNEENEIGRPTSQLFFADERKIPKFQPRTRMRERPKKYIGYRHFEEKKKDSHCRARPRLMDRFFRPKRRPPRRQLPTRFPVAPKTISNDPIPLFVSTTQHVRGIPMAARVFR